MATRALQQVLTYLAWNTSTNAYVTGDVANHTTSWVKDGTRAATTNSAAEVDSTNFPGLYKVTMTATETDCIEGVLGGKSSTANVVLIPTMVAFDYLNTSAPATAGVPDVNVKNMNNVAATSITTINANQGTTQPLNFTGTAGSALVKSDMVDIAGAAVSTSSAQIGVNVVNAGGTAWGSGAITAGSIAASALNGKGDWLLASSYTAPPTAAAIATGVWQDTTAGDFTVASSIGKSLYTSGNAPGAASGLALVGSNMGTVSSVTGSVGSVTGNVAGSVGSVTGAVGSVTAAVTVGTNNDKTGYSLTSAEENAIADAILGRNVAGGSSTGRLVKEALYVLRNKVDTGAGIVYGTDDTTSAWTFTVTQAAGNPITVIDPA